MKTLRYFDSRVKDLAFKFFVAGLGGAITFLAFAFESPLIEKRPESEGQPLLVVGTGANILLVYLLFNRYNLIPKLKKLFARISAAMTTYYFVMGACYGFFLLEVVFYGEPGPLTLKNIMCKGLAAVIYTMCLVIIDIVVKKPTPNRIRIKASNQ